MGIRNDASSLIFFAFWDRRPKTETPNYQFGTNYILVSSAFWESSG